MKITTGSDIHCRLGNITEVTNLLERGKGCRFGHLGPPLGAATVDTVHPRLRGEQVRPPDIDGRRRSISGCNALVQHVVLVVAVFLKTVREQVTVRQ